MYPHLKAFLNLGDIPAIQNVWSAKDISDRYLKHRPSSYYSSLFYIERSIKKANYLRACTKNYKSAKGALNTSGFVKDKISLFDCTCSIGRPKVIKAYPRFSEINTVDHLLKEMDFYGIERALVSHFGDYLPVPMSDMDANSWLSSAISGEDRLYAAWTITPFRNLEEISSEAMRRNKFRAVSLFPLRDKYAFDDWVVGDLFERLNRLKLLTFIHMVSLTQETYSGMGERAVELVGGSHRGMEYWWSQVYELAKKYNDTPIVLSRLTGDGGGYQNMINIILDKLDNIYIDLSNYHCLNSIEDMVEMHGPERFLFGTWMPWQDPGQTIAQLTYAEISQRDKELIGGKNIERLLKEEKL